MISDEAVAQRLSELGHPTRLAVYRLLVKGSKTGMTVGDVQQQLGIPGSTLSHHLSRLIQAGLVQQTREGRILRCQVDMDALDEVIDYLKAECCTL
ncbi:MULTISPECIES: helix-turn-helix transcriptional regulator [Ferrimonas]|uniref:DNA-binding transcriptional regulator, ArsR family n=1 Tax=Ferrimonas sediminum TaxID=718193 RepID=A0A1G8Q8P2_9GAMM|nr:MULTISPECIES: metalloregulator ArsR/SmtB family transcription factor [Ferrimonas]USD38349.1 helix-turn-helix transcriptional regulator [Ferrimonas sp. SCSIO 43195]SDJ01071.1 DNA-binding transcriptional regulator, ArsR family [Ferrimonas sediminum]